MSQADRPTDIPRRGNSPHKVNPEEEPPRAARAASVRNAHKNGEDTHRERPILVPYERLIGGQTPPTAARAVSASNTHKRIEDTPGERPI